MNEKTVQARLPGVIVLCRRRHRELSLLHLQKSGTSCPCELIKTGFSQPGSKRAWAPGQIRRSAHEADSFKLSNWWHLSLGLWFLTSAYQGKITAQPFLHRCNQRLTVHRSVPLTTTCSNAQGSPSGAWLLLIVRNEKVQPVW